MAAALSGCVIVSENKREVKYQAKSQEADLYGIFVETQRVHLPAPVSEEKFGAVHLS